MDLSRARTTCPNAGSAFETDVVGAGHVSLMR
jgi:hypothetical protein